MTTIANPTPFTVHELKTWPAFFQPQADGVKTFEIRKDDRRPRYAVGDVLHLREYIPARLGDDEYGCVSHFAPEYTGRECFRRVTYIARDPEGEIVPVGLCVMSVVECERPESPDVR
jgi:hypothetical protein